MTQMSAQGLALLKRFEGFRSQIYKDVAGLATIGYGHRLLSTESFPGGLDEAQAIELLENDVRAAELAVRRLVKPLLTQGQFDALVDFVFNLGVGRLASSTLLKELNAERFDSAAEQLLRWDHSGAQEIEGLKARRTAEFALWHGTGTAQEAAA